MRPIRVCIYGGTDRDGMPPQFVSELARAILSSMPAVIVTGGFLHSLEHPAATSTDAAALSGARRHAADKPRDLKECFEAWVPEPFLDCDADKGVMRMSDADGVTVRVMTGRTPLGRRLAMVAGVDMVVTIAGGRHTEVVVEQALELGVPVLPIPDAGGDSKDMLEKHRAKIASAFGAGALEHCLDRLSKALGRNEADAAAAVVELIRTAKVGKCLMLCPFDPEHDRLYESVVFPAIARHMIPHRLDRQPKSESIHIGLGDAVRSCWAVVTDITRLNENVMYEIGFAHGHGVRPLIYTRDAARLDDLPLYFQMFNVRLASDGGSVAALIEEYLQAVKAARRVPLQ